MCDDDEPEDELEEDWADDEKCSPVPIRTERVKTDQPLVPKGRVYWPLQRK